MHAVLDYFTDINRLKHFHEISRTNLYKTKAYEISWLLRRRPIQFIRFRIVSPIVSAFNISTDRGDAGITKSCFLTVE